MATSLQCDVSAALRWVFQTDDGDSARAVLDANTVSLIDALTDGSGSDQANKVYHARLSIANASPVTLDIAGGLTDVFGNTITMTAVKAMMILNHGTTDSALLTVGGTFKSYMQSGASTSLYVGRGGGVLLWNPTLTAWTVTAGTGDTITITSSGENPITCDVVIIGK